MPGAAAFRPQPSGGDVANVAEDLRPLAAHPTPRLSVAVASQLREQLRLDPDEQSVALARRRKQLLNPNPRVKPREGQVRVGLKARDLKPAALVGGAIAEVGGRSVACINGSHGPSRLTPPAIAHNPSPWLHGRRT